MSSFLHFVEKNIFLPSSLLLWLWSVLTVCVDNYKENVDNKCLHYWIILENWSTVRKTLIEVQAKKVKSEKQQNESFYYEYRVWTFWQHNIFCTYITSMAEIQSVSVLFAKQMTYYRKGFAFLYVNSFSWKAYPEKQMFCPQSPLLSIFRNSLKKKHTHTCKQTHFSTAAFGKWHSDFSLAFQLVLPTSIVYVFCKGLFFQTRNMYFIYFSQ